MGILLYNQPDTFSLAYNDNAYVMRSTAYTATQRFRILVLPFTWPVDPQLAEVRVYPRQGVDSSGIVTQDRAYYDPSRILQSVLAPNISIPGANNDTIFSCPNMFKKYLLYIEEEDKNGSGVYVSGDSLFTTAKTVWNGVRNTRGWLDFDYTDYDMTNGTTDKKYLTDAPLTRYIDSDQSAFLYFLTSDLDPDRVLLKSYDSDGNQIVSTYIGIVPTTTFNRIAVGHYDLMNSDTSNWNTSNPTAFFTGCVYYTVQVQGQETVTFYLDQKCGKYTPIRLHWLNRLGGFDSFNFNMKSVKETDVKRSDFEKQHHSFSGTSWSYSSDARGTTDYDVQLTDNIEINTDYLTDEEAVWMEDLITSPVVYQELDNELIAVNIKNKKYTEQTSLNDKLKQYNIELEYSLKSMRQRG